jgi:hypothetical protein
MRTPFYGYGLVSKLIYLIGIVHLEMLVEG